MREVADSSPKLTKRMVLGMGLGAAVLGAGLATWRYRMAQPQDEALQALWAFESELASGEKFALTGARGRPVLINFWATWCPPCVEELPLIEAFFVENKSKNWQVVAIAADNAKNVKAFLQKNPLSFPAPLAGMAGVELSRTLGNLSGALPFSVVLNAQGNIAWRQIGKLSVAQLSEISKIS